MLIMTEPKKPCKACKLVLFETYFVSDVGDYNLSW